MILTRAPLRISFAGGGTDLPAFIRQHEYGQVVSATLDASVYVAVNRRFEGGVRASYSRTEDVAHAPDLKHKLLRAACAWAGVWEGVEIATIADVPGRGTGLGSSGATAVAALLALGAYMRRATDAATLADVAGGMEISHGGGVQDAYAAAYGGLRLYRFTLGPEGDTTAALRCDLAALEQYLMLFRVGEGRDAGQMLQAQQQAIADGQYDAEMLGMREGVQAMVRALEVGDWQGVGALLSLNWARKRRLPGAASVPVDSVLRLAQQAGAWGGKLCGAGGEGFVLLVAPPDAQQSIRRAVQPFVSGELAPVRLSSQGARVVYDRC